ncbi:hypothetical protein E2C01_084413 [Portunus trituberculatus]|uniref:Uncharacterized protein n=1 Tax=Portunus trituberculatus TaxID=210409 RepID=A0A5B7J4R4_PORTR|nr:hypothetical protein [Portunus trituberculatus]
MKPFFSAAAPHLSQPSCPTTGTSTTPAVFLPLPQRTAIVSPVPPNTVPQAGFTQELHATDATQQLMAMVSALAAKVDNLTATVSGLSTEFAAFKNQQHTVYSETSTVAPTPSPASGAQQGQGESDVYQHSLCDPTQEKEQCCRAMCNCYCTHTEDGYPCQASQRSHMTTPEPSGMAPAPPASESKSPVADCEEDNAGEWTDIGQPKEEGVSQPKPSPGCQPRTRPGTPEDCQPQARLGTSEDCQPQARPGTSDGSHTDADRADVLPDTGSGWTEDTDEHHIDEW